MTAEDVHPSGADDPRGAMVAALMIVAAAALTPTVITIWLLPYLL